MIYEVVLTDVAKKQLRKLPKTAQKQIGGVIERIKVRPHRHITRILGSPYFRARAGDYRIVCDVKNDVLLIIVIEVERRKRVYRRK